MSLDVVGRINAIETLGTLDGPGVRLVIFLQGCPFRCVFCHNPETQNFRQGKEVSVRYIMNTINRYRSYLKEGGITISGGEPFSQPEFISSIIYECKKESIHTAIDTSGLADHTRCTDAILNCDLMLIDIKHIDVNKCIEITGHTNEKALSLLKFCSENNIKVWVRHVVMDEFDSLEDIRILAEYVSKFNNVEKLQLLPYHTLYKDKQFTFQYSKAITPPTEQFMNSANKISTEIFNNRYK